MARLPQTNTTVSRYLRQQGRVVTRLANSTPYALSGTSVVAPGLMKVDERLVAGTPGGSRVELDSAGLRKYAADGTTVQVDLTGEVAAFSGLITGSEIIGGTLRTATSGSRVEILPEGLGGGEGGTVQVYTGSVRELTPGGLSTLASDVDTDHQADTVVYGPHLTHVDPGDDTVLSPPLLLLEMVLDDAVPANDASLVVLMADHLNIILNEATGRLVTTPAEFITHARTRHQRIGSGPQSLATRWRSKEVLIVDDAAHLAELLSELSPDLTPTAPDPLLIWLCSAAAGEQLRYTTDGTTWTVIGGGGGSTLFADPGADKLVFWDDSAGAFAPLTASTGLTLTGTDLTVRAASAAQTGIVQLATAMETYTGSINDRAATPNGVKYAIDNYAPAAADELFAGIVELATTAEAVAGTDTVRATTPAGVKAAVYAPGASTGVSYSAGWANDATHEAVTWYKDKDGYIRLTGYFKRTGTTVAAGFSGTIFTLPVGARPSGNTAFFTNKDEVTVSLQIYTNGIVQSYNPASAWAGGSSYMYLGIVMFKAA